MNPIPLILDCDPGVDDAVALALAFGARERLELLGITTTAGNVDLAKTTRNACLIRQIMGREDVPIHAGLAKPLSRDPIIADDFHGPEGLGDYPASPPSLGPQSTDAVSFLIQTIETAPANTISLAVTGPLTNIACLIQQAPATARRLRQIVLMGGARREGGNITASAEYNIYADPEAADITFNSGCNIVAFGLDATHQVRGTSAWVEAIARLDTPGAKLVADMLAFSNALPANLMDTSDPDQPATGAPLHDPCVIAYLLAPEAFSLRPCRIEVETTSTLTRGHTVVEFRKAVAGEFNANWVWKANPEAVLSLLLRYLA
jgi:purine nucleosidase